jgi:hypothetical protein
MFDLTFAVQTEHPTLHYDDSPNARQGCVVDEDVSLSIAICRWEDGQKLKLHIGKENTADGV